MAASLRDENHNDDKRARHPMFAGRDSRRHLACHARQHGHVLFFAIFGKTGHCPLIDSTRKIAFICLESKLLSTSLP
jgi:hypothetical protein